MSLSPDAALKRNQILFSLGILLFWASMYVYVPILSVYAEALGASLSVVGLAVGMYGFTQLLTRIPLGIWSDASGKRRIFVTGGMLICAVSAAGLALFPNPFWIIVFRGMMGFAASTWVCSTVLFASYFRGRDPSVPLSIMSFMSALGQVIGTFAGGLLAEHWGWTAPFWASVGLALIAAVVVSLPPDDTSARPVAVTPQSMFKIARAPLLVLACILGVVAYFATYSTVYGFTTVWAERAGASRAELGYLTTAALIGYSASTLFTPRFVKWWGTWRTLWVGLGLIALSILPIPLTTDLTLLSTLQFASGIGRGLLYPLLMGLAIQAVRSEDRASAMGIFQAVYALGMTVGPWVSGGVADVWGLPAVFYMCGGLCFVTLAIAIPATSRPAWRQASHSPL